MIDDLGWNFINGILIMIGFMVLCFFTEDWLAYAYALGMICLCLGRIESQLKQIKRTEPDE